MNDDALIIDDETLDGEKKSDDSDDSDLAGFDWGSDLDGLAGQDDDLFASLGVEESSLEDEAVNPSEIPDETLDLSGLGLKPEEDEDDALKAFAMDDFGMMLDDESHPVESVEPALEDDFSLDHLLEEHEPEDSLAGLGFAETDAIQDLDAEQPWYEQTDRLISNHDEEEESDYTESNPLDIAVSQLDLLELSELKELIAQAEERVHLIELENMERLDQFLQEKAQELGVNVEVFLRNKGLFTKPEEAEKPAFVEVEVDKKKKKKETEQAKPYANPNNPEERWSGNIKGRKPEWVNQELDKAMIKYKGWDRDVVLVEIMQAWLSE